MRELFRFKTNRVGAYNYTYDRYLAAISLGIEPAAFDSAGELRLRYGMQLYRSL